MHDADLDIAVPNLDTVAGCERQEIVRELQGIFRPGEVFDPEGRNRFPSVDKKEGESFQMRRPMPFRRDR